ncbi:MAG: iron-containing alcohol dehydrogenase, partial [Verrucomicrobiae bacterium]|nr:iron-containing alcohol dehydrogenase [Verrucomicrobiae bacterium]
MQNFVYHNPTKLVFGKGTIAQLSDLVPTGLKVLMTYGGGSIKRNGVYDQVKAALKGRDLIEFGGIEPNPRYETLMKAVEVCRREKVEFLLAVGGGSVLDGTKFIAVAAFYEAGDPWDILAKNAKPTRALPIGCVLTLPATGSESNPIAVISREATREKLAFSTPLVYPTFSIIDPETHYSLPRRQVQNGIADAFVHVMEQYLTYPADAPVQDRLAEGIARTLIEYGPKVLRQPRNYNARAAIALCST